MANFSMNDEVKRMLADIVNPATGSTLDQEDRIREVHATKNAVTVKYDREDISSAHKKDIESQMLERLCTIYEEDCVSLLSVSENSKDVGESEHQCGCGHGGGHCHDEEDSHGHDDKHDHEGCCGGHDHDHGHSHGHSHDHEDASLKVGHSGMPVKRKVAAAKKVIAVASGKGGVGKSTVTVNLAMSLAAQGKKVGIVDADIYGPSIPMLMGKRTDRPVAGDQNKILPLEAHGVKFVSFGSFINESDPVIWRGPMLGGILNQFLFDVDWGQLDYLLIDMPPGTGDMPLSLAQNAEVDGVLIVSTPQDVALLDSKKGLYMFQKVQVPVLGMIENMGSFICEHGTEYFIFGQGGVEKACKEIGTKYFGSIPMEVELRESSDKGHPYMANKNFEGRRVWKAYKELAKKVVEL